MSHLEEIDVCLYDYDKLNTVSVFRRLTTDIHGRELHDWKTGPDDPKANWRWIKT